MKEVVLTGKVLNFNHEDDCGDIFSPDGLTIADTVAVNLEFDADCLVGTAELKKTKTGVVAKITAPEKNVKLVDTLLKGAIIPAVGGWVRKRSKKNPKIIEKFEINQIGLCGENADKTIKPLKVKRSKRRK